MSLENAPAVLPDQAPDYALAVLQQFGLTPIIDTALAGISAGMPPTIGCKGTRFKVTDEGETRILNKLEIAVVILAAKEAMTKRWYADAFNEDAEAEAPDCWSDNGVSPDPGCKMKQSEVCATCLMNQFGSGKDAQGNPSKGKACGDRKVLAVFVGTKPYRMEITPAALKNFGNYVRQQLNPRGIDLRTVKTIIGFAEDASYPQYTFKFGGLLTPEELPKILQWIDTPETEAIINPSGTHPALPATTPTTVVQQTVVQEVVKEVVKEVVQEPVIVDDGFGDLGGGAVASTPAAKTTRATKQTKAVTQETAAAVTAAAAPSDDALASALGLDL